MNTLILAAKLYVVPTKGDIISDKLTTAGIIVLFVFLFIFLIWCTAALIHELRKKRQEQLPGVVGDSKELFERTCDLAMLSVSERHVLKKIAWKMKLAQPSSLLISPNLLAKAAVEWEKKCRFGPTRKWGAYHLNEVAKKLFNQKLA